MRWSKMVDTQKMKDTHKCVVVLVVVLVRRGQGA